MSKLRETLSQYWITIQGSLFPWLKGELGELTKKQQDHGFPGCPLKSRSAIARAFIAKMVYQHGYCWTDWPAT